MSSVPPSLATAAIDPYDLAGDDPAVDEAPLSTSLPVDAHSAYELFTDVERIPAWLAVVRSAHVQSRYVDGRARRASFLAVLERATIGYTVSYAYDPGRWVVSWTTPPGASIHIAGLARFTPMSARVCMMDYALELRMPPLARWNAPHYQGHTASAVLCDFRDYVRSQLP